VQFHRKKKTATRTSKNVAEMPEESVLAEMQASTVKVDKLVKEFLTAQTLTILPQNSFGDAVTQFVDKDDKHAMEQFVDESLSNQLKHLLAASGVEEDDLITEMDQYKSKLEGMFAAGKLKKTKRSNLKAKPIGWDSDEDGHWADDPGALIRPIDEEEEEEEEDGDDASLASVSTKKPAARGRGKAAGTTRKTAAATKKAVPAAKSARGKKKVVEEEEDDDDDEDVIMVSDDDEESDDAVLFVPEVKKAPAKKPAARASARAKSPAKKATTSRAKAPAAKQSTLNFSQTQRSQPTRAPPARGRKVAEPVSDHRCNDESGPADHGYRATMRSRTMMPSTRRLRLEALGRGRSR
jgi:double-strand break repair protein MRE11